MDRETEYHAHLIEHLLAHIIRTERHTMTEIDTLTADVARNGDVEASAVTLLQGLAAQITANAGNPAKLAELAATLTTQSDALAAAVIANTPAAPPAPPAA